MKKIYLLFALAFTLTTNAQVTNGDLESWVDLTTPSNFSASPFTASVTKESTIKHGGSFSAKHTTPLVTVPATPTSVKIQNESATIIPGHSYTISYWYLDNDVNAKARPWIYWITSSTPGVAVTDATSDAVFRPSTYSVDSANWVQFTATFTAPATSAKLRFEMRSYNVGTVGGGIIYYDDMTVVDNGILSVSQNQIAGLSINPNPVSNGVFYVNTTANETKNIIIVDLLGKQVLNTTTSGNEINVSKLNAGVYIVKVTEEGKTATRKLVIQ